MPELVIGTSGWQYRDWKERFYPKTLPQRAWLEYYAHHFPCVEVNNTFYRLPSKETLQRWAEATPQGFRFAVKASQYLTHSKRLLDPEQPVDRLMEYCGELGSRLGPILLQLPPNMKVDTQRLDHALSCFPEDTAVAVEFRHNSWLTEGVQETMRKHGAATCLADRNGQVSGPLWRTADWGYLRLHEGDGDPHPHYRPATLQQWAKRLEKVYKQSDRVFVFFNNDHLGAAVEDAGAMTELARQTGLKVS